MLYFFLTIIAIGVLLISEPGRKILKYTSATALILILLILIIILALWTFDRITGDDELQLLEVENSDYQSTFSGLKRVTSFNDYSNTDQSLSEKIKLSNIENPHPMVIEMYQIFPEFAGHYAPTSTIHDVQNIDIDNDGVDEQVIYYSCIGCNAPARNIDIAKNNKVIFTVKGGNLRLENVDNQDAFYVLTTMVPRGQGDIKIEFIKSLKGGYIAMFEENTY